MPDRKTADWQIIAALVFIAFLAGTGVYVGCYFAMTTKLMLGSGTNSRIYSADWVANMFIPAAKVESWFIGFTVEALGPQPDPQIWLDLDYKMSGDLDLFSIPLPLAEDFIAQATAREWPQWEFYDKFGMPRIEERSDELVFLYDCRDASVQLTVVREKFEKGIVDAVEGAAY
jgi:hypothetical protein